MKKLFAFAFAAMMLAGCVKSPLVGGIYTDVKDGLAVTGNAGSSKVGTAEAKGYVGVVALGDASIQAAAREAGITRIHHVDYQAKSYVGVYTIYTINVSCWRLPSASPEPRRSRRRISATITSRKPRPTG
jgi:hypothetical protein